jgi:hypothetical protein
MVNKNLAKLLAEAESEKILELEQTNIKLLKQLEKSKNKTQALVDAVYDAVKTSITTYRAGKVPKPTLPTKKAKGTEIACAVLSDVQLAKVTPTYNTKVAEERVVRYAHKIVELTNIQRQATNQPSDS